MKTGLFIFLLLLMNCSQTQMETLAGGATEVEGTISGHIVNKDNKPVYNAKILLRNTFSNTDSLFGETQSNHQGFWSIQGCSTGSWTIESQVVNSNDTLVAFKSTYLLENDFVDLGSIVPDSVSELKIHILSEQQIPTMASLLIYGTGTFSKTDSLHLVNLPEQGSYWAKVQTPDGYVTEIHFVRNFEKEIQLTLPAKSFLLLEDFDTPMIGTDYSNKISSLFGSGWWYVDLPDSDESLVVPETSIQNFSSALTTDPDSIQNSVLHLQFSQVSSYALAGVNLINATHGINLAEMDSLTIRIKGKGALNLELISGIYRDTSVKVSDFTQKISLDSVWKTVVIYPDSLTVFPQNQFSLTWNESAIDLRFIQFLFNQDGEFWLDDLKIYGPTLNQLFDSSRK